MIERWPDVDPGQPTWLITSPQSTGPRKLDHATSYAGGNSQRGSKKGEHAMGEITWNEIHVETTRKL